MKKLSIYILFISLSCSLKAQQKFPLSDKIESYHKTFPKEKLYLSFDKPYYNVGDTLWFKSFLLNGSLGKNTLSDKIYVELFNDSSRLIEKRAIMLNNGLGYGDFILNKKLSEGTYILRAHTNWQQNFGNDYFFHRRINIGNVGQQTFLVDSYQKLNTSTNNNTLDLKIRLRNINDQPVGLRDIEMYLMDGQKRVMKADLRTSIDGKIETTLPLPAKLDDNYTFYMADKKDKTRKAILPILLQDVDEVDLQFMPEGGYLVNDIYGKVAFKAVGADGIGREINGKIVNSKNENVIEFKSQHRGMGSFFFFPQKGETYSAVYSLNGKEKRTTFPKAKEEGTTLRIDHISKPDSLLIYVKASETKRMDQNYQLNIMVGDEIVMMVPINLKNGFSTLKLPKKGFPDGVAHITLFSPDLFPLNERSIFINRNRKLQLEISKDQPTYQKRDSIVLNILATNEEGTPTAGTFAVSVTDDSQVKQSVNDENIISHFLLQSEVKGNIEDAGWYFFNEEKSTLIALDHLLLTQAWIGYEWDKILKHATIPAFKAEKGNLIEGKVIGLLNKPMPKTDLKLLSLGKTVFFADTVTNAQGTFTFKNIPLLDSPAYAVKIKNSKGKTAAGNIIVDEFIPPKSLIAVKPIKPWYVNADSTSLNYFNNVERQKKLVDPARLVLEGNQLKEVEIKVEKRLNDFIEKTAWDAKFFKKITEEELKQTPNKTLADLLKEKIPNFNVGYVWPDGCSARPSRHATPSFLIGTSLIGNVMIDKISTGKATGIDDRYNETGASIGGSGEIFSTNSFIFNALSASDVVDIVVYKGCYAYFLDITTRSGKGPWAAPTKGSYVFRPIPIYTPKEFYSPKYAIDKTSTALSDLRSTIFWDANVVTDENGKAKLSFYAADLPGSYTIKVEGTDLMGRFGYQKSVITIKNKTESK